MWNSLKFSLSTLMASFCLQPPRTNPPLVFPSMTGSKYSWKSGCCCLLFLSNLVIVSMNNVCLPDIKREALPSIKCAQSSGGEHTGLRERKASVGLSTLWSHVSSAVDSVLALPQSGVFGSRGSSTSLVCHVGLCFIVCTDHCSLRSKRGTRDSWNLLKCKRLTSLCMFIMFLSFYFTFFKYHTPLTFKRGDQLDKVLKVQMRKCA